MNNITKPIATTKNRIERKSNVMSFPVLKAKSNFINLYHAKTGKENGSLSVFNVS
jgi:hypothetical protein